MKLYVDLDGVLGDFNTHYRNLVGELPGGWGKTDFTTGEHTNGVDWKLIEANGFFHTMPKMKDADRLWDYIERYKPIVITGCPTTGRYMAGQRKRSWVARNYGIHVKVITCLSKEKCNYTEPGDILIDDWERYKPDWEAKGGIWITHINTVQTIVNLQRLGL